MCYFNILCREICFRWKRVHHSGRGAFFEEGFAENLRAAYVKKYMYDDPTFPLGVDGVVSVEFRSSFGLSLEIDVHTSYLLMNTEDKIHGNSSLAAGIAFELIMENVPEFRNVCIDARSNISSLRKIPRLVDFMANSQLYTRLATMSPDTRGYIDGLLCVAIALNYPGVRQI